MKKQQPNKHLITIINYIALVPLVYFIPALLQPILPDNKFVQVCMVVAVIVPIISYIVMPATMKILSGQGANTNQLQAKNKSGFARIKLWLDQLN